MQLYFYFRYFLPLSKFKPTVSEKFPKLSLIIAAKNESTNLSQTLGAILQQNYEDFEVIVVDDHSSDDTFSRAQSFKDNRIKVFRLENGRGKKKAIEKGIAEAGSEHLIFTDADCIPASDEWLKMMSGSFALNKEIVLGYGRMKREKGFLNRLSRFETFLTAIQYFSMALKGEAYMGVGRNLAYTETLYRNSSSFQKFTNYRGGDDDLFVNEMANGTNVAICFAKEAHTISQTEKKWWKYICQKRRHLEVGRAYQTKHKISLAVYGFSNLLFYIGLLILLILKFNPELILTIFVIKQLIQVFIFKKLMNEFLDKDLLPWISLLEPFYLLAISLIGVSTYFWKVDKWK